MVLKEIKGLSLRGIVKELHSNEAYRALIQKVILLYELNTGHKAKDVAIDSTMVKPCKDHRAQLQRKQHKYLDTLQYSNI